MSDNRPGTLWEMLEVVVDFLDMGEYAFKIIADAKGEVYEPSDEIQTDLINLAAYLKLHPGVSEAIYEAVYGR